MMKVVFSSISNSSRGDLQANEANRGKLASKNSFKPKIKYARPKAEQGVLNEQTSREVFASLVNASSCANLLDEKVLDGYVTFAQGPVLKRKCL
jgi:hypothetical protein